MKALRRTLLLCQSFQFGLYGGDGFFGGRSAAGDTDVVMAVEPGRFDFIGGFDEVSLRQAAAQFCQPVAVGAGMVADDKHQIDFIRQLLR